MVWIVWIGFALLVGALASSFRRNFVGWFFLAIALSPIIAGIIVLGVGKLEEPTKACPKCAEFVKPKALVCKHCGHEFAAPLEAIPSATTPDPYLG